jgi:hypothetical protein
MSNIIKKIKLLNHPQIIKWVSGNIYGWLNNKNDEHIWGNYILNSSRNIYDVNIQANKNKYGWSGRLGEILVGECLANICGGYENIKIQPKFASPYSKTFFRPDFETDFGIIEVKSGAYYTPSSSHEKILSTPYKYAEIPEITGKPLYILCVGGAEFAARHKFALIPSPDPLIEANMINNPDSDKNKNNILDDYLMLNSNYIKLSSPSHKLLRDTYEQMNIGYIGFSDLLTKL